MDSDRMESSDTVMDSDRMESSDTVMEQRSPTLIGSRAINHSAPSMEGVDEEVVNPDSQETSTLTSPTNDDDQPNNDAACGSACRTICEVNMRPRLRPCSGSGSWKRSSKRKSENLAFLHI